MKEKLFVIFHGSWAFVDNRDKKGDPWIHVLAPDVAEHVTMAGSWLGELKIPRHSRLDLDVGVCPDECECIWQHESGFVLFPPRPDDTCLPRPYAEIRVPRPVHMYPQLVVHSPDVKLDDNENLISRNLGLVPVFEYEINDGPTLRHSDGAGARLFWKPPVDAPRPLTLHIFTADDAASRKDDGADFRKVAELLGHPATMKNDVEMTLSMRRANVPGLEGREFEICTFLHERVDHLRAIGAQMQLRGSKSLFYWDPPMPLGTEFMLKAVDYSSCGGGGGGS